ncbi:hypothetical protein GCM10023085_19200 [Actinomadura viridis]
MVVETFEAMILTCAIVAHERDSFTAAERGKGGADGRGARRGLRFSSREVRGNLPRPAPRGPAVYACPLTRGPLTRGPLTRGPLTRRPLTRRPLTRRPYAVAPAWVSWESWEGVPVTVPR